jgi:hypothetical protein
MSPVIRNPAIMDLLAVLIIKSCRNLREESGNTVASVTNCLMGPRETLFYNVSAENISFF